MKEDLKSRKDIENLIAEFYKKAIQDELIGKFFTTVMVLDWNKHIPIICNFWDSLIFDAHNYKGNPMLKHIELSRKEKLMPNHFERWLLIWNQTIDANFIGPKADLAKEKAHQIGGLMKFKVGNNS